MRALSLKEYKADQTLLALPKCVLFDWDNTLVDSFEGITRALNQVYKHFGLPVLSKEEVIESCHLSARDVFPVLFPQDSQKAFDIFYDYIETHHLKHLTLFEETLPLLQALKKRNIYIGLVSNKKKEILLKEVQYLHLDHFFEVIIGSGDCLEDKPSPIPILHALRKLPIEIADLTKVLYVGDAPTDKEAAMAAHVMFYPISEHSDLNDLHNILIDYTL